MTKDQESIKGKAACFRSPGNLAIGYSRDSFCRFKELYDNGGELALQEISRKKPILANRTASGIAARIVEFSLEQPAFGQQIRAATAESYESRGVPEKEAERRAWATVNKESGAM